MIPLIPVAMQLAQFAPMVLKWLTGSDKAEEAASAVVRVAATVAGSSDPVAALATITGDPKLQHEFRMELLHQEKDMDAMYLADVKSARDRDVEIRKTGQRNWRAETMYALAVLMIVCLVLIVWKSLDLPEYAKGIFTLVLGRFLGYLDSIYNFEFGTTRANKTKDETIERLTK